MSAVLHKRSSTTALGASLELITPAKRQPAPEQDERDVTIARLKVERDGLQQKLLIAERQRAEELDAIKADARAAAAHDFKRDDSRRIEILAAAVEASLSLFKAHLITQSRGLAPALARQALEQLVRGREVEADWLARVIERRLETLTRQSVVSVAIAREDFGDAVVQQLSRQLAAGAAVIADPSLKPGTARIVLRLGEVVVDPAAGVDRLLAMLDELGGDDA